MKKSTGLIALVFALLIASDASANMRAPYEVDGELFAATTEQTTDSIVLQKEDLAFEFGPHRESDSWPEPLVSVTAAYTLHNTSDESVDLVLVFLATDISGPKVTVNGKAADGAVKTESMNQKQIDEFWANYQRASGLTPDDVLRKRADRDGKPPKRAVFSVSLKPGDNVVKFAYQHGAIFLERGPSYGKPKLQDSVIGVDYLLYPAEAWKRAPDFELDVRVVAKDWWDDDWFFDDQFEAKLFEPGAFKGEYDEKKGGVVYRKTFKDFPSPILSIRLEQGRER